MKRVIIDTNLWISFLIGKRLKNLQTLFLHDDVKIYVCKELVDEILDVARRPKLAKYIKDEDLDLLDKLLHTYCSFFIISKHSDLPIRDPKDLYLLSLCESIPADFVLSGDDDLLSVETGGKYKIMKFADFMDLLESNC